MKKIFPFYASLIFGLIIFKWSCKQGKQKNETSETKTAPGEIECTVLPIKEPS